MKNKHETRATAYLGLGANEGDRLTALRAALDALDRHPEIEVDHTRGIASLYETQPVGGPAEQDHYLNSTVRITTTLGPQELLQTLLAIEDALGRVRSERWGPRVVDLDLLLYDDALVDDAELTVPHPRLHQRLFVLEPLSEVAAEVIHPALEMTVDSLLHQQQQHGEPRAAEASDELPLTRVAGPKWEQGYVPPEVAAEPAQPVA